ncbi:MAG: conjugal transfer protein [Candidatus Dormibacteraeota bacterium]|nr:conjugal transfer protein [Candidatus Dormibacteraeota bacterium]
MPVYTGLLQVRRELWHIQDLVLPRSVPMIPAGVFVAVLLSTLWLAHVVGLMVPVQWWALYALPAVAAYWIANRPLVEGRTIQRWLWCQLCYPFQPRRLVRWEPVWRAERLRLDLKVYQPRRRGW